MKRIVTLWLFFLIFVNAFANAFLRAMVDGLAVVKQGRQIRHLPPFPSYTLPVLVQRDIRAREIAALGQPGQSPEENEEYLIKALFIAFKIPPLQYTWEDKDTTLIYEEFH